jgi:hypothetical protein
MTLSRLLARTVRVGSCLVWTGCVGSHGYPLARHEGRVTTVGRIVLTLLGHDLAGLDACHSCDESRCIAPDHLWPGTRAENVADAIQRGTLVRDEAGRWA